MDIKSQLTILSELCRKEAKIRQAEEQINRLSGKSKNAQKAALDLQGSLAQIERELNDKKRHRKEVDEALQIEKANLRKWEVRAEKIRGEREYTALMSEIGSLKKSIARFEEQLSKANEELTQIENKKRSLSGEREQNLTVAEEAFDAVKSDLGEQEVVLSNLRVGKEELIQKLPREMQNRYARIGTKRPNYSLAFLNHEVCQACMRTIPPELSLRIAKGELIEQCPSCQRILVMDIFSTATKDQ